jgi:midasin (ATPase involved in ribosome maturation)
MLTDELREKYLIIIDEINTLPMSVLKAFQPILDDTEGTFEFDNKTYSKNPNVFFIATMNHKDVGTSPLPKAIKSRFFPVFFKDLDNTELSKRTNVPVEFLDLLKRIYDMFSPMGDVHEFFNDVRQLKNMSGLTTEQFRDYITSHLELSGIEWQNAVAISPEFDNLVAQYSNIKW